MNELEKTALTFLEKTLQQFKNPAVMCSFGKDSLVALHLTRQVANLPVVFHRQPFYPIKYKYANQVIEEWDLTVYDYPPHKCAIQQKGEDIEIIGYYDIGNNNYCGLPTGICAPQDGERVLCALHDIYLKPKGRFAYPWDCVVHGHKSCDVDPFYGSVKLNADIGLNIGTASPIFPIREWSHADVWEYIERHQLPIHHERYEKLDGEWVEKKDKKLNPDYFPACCACMKAGGGSVKCPRFVCEISNVSKQLEWTTPTRTTYIEEEK